jgi:hypothetical protein
MLTVTLAEDDVVALLDLLEMIPVDEVATAVRSALETGQQATIAPGGRVRVVSFADTQHAQSLLKSVEEILKHGKPSQDKRRCLNRARARLYSATSEAGA